MVGELARVASRPRSALCPDARMRRRLDTVVRQRCGPRRRRYRGHAGDDLVEMVEGASAGRQLPAAPLTVMSYTLHVGNSSVSFCSAVGGDGVGIGGSAGGGVGASSSTAAAAEASGQRRVGDQSFAEGEMSAAGRERDVKEDESDSGVNNTNLPKYPFTFN